MKQNVQHESDKNTKPNKAQKKEHTDAGVPIQGECDPNLMASHQELLEYELKCEEEKTTNPRKSRPKEITLGSSGKVMKKPKLSGPKKMLNLGTRPLNTQKMSWIKPEGWVRLPEKGVVITF